MALIARLQGYLRESAARRYVVVAAPPFSLFFHPDDAFPYFNYAIPDKPIEEPVDGALALLRSEFKARGRLPRFEFIEAYAPQLVSALQSAGFVEEARQSFMVCTPETVCEVPPVDGLTIQPVAVDAPLSDVLDYVTVQRRGFDPTSTEPVSEAEAERLRAMLQIGAAFLARLNGEAAAVAMATEPIDGVTEIVGIATIPELRRRGIATALTAYTLRAAFAAGAEIACLTAGDEGAEHIYTYTGFLPYATMLAYREIASTPTPA